MATGFLALLDDIAAMMDDVAMMSKVAGKKTAGILGDDLAVNAEKSSGFASSRELPVLWAIAKGSLINKLIILPAAFALSAILPAAIHVILILGGLFLAYEGAEKVFEYFIPLANAHDEDKEVVSSESDILAIEKTKIKSAILTDFILSVEIVIIAMGTVLDKPILIQIIVVSIIALIATFGVYGIVALIVRMDEMGFKLIQMSKNEKSITHKIGQILVKALPKVIKSLAVIGTIALLLVAGGIFVHNSEFLHHLLPQIPDFVKEFAVGLIAGSIVLAVVMLVNKIKQK
jgi:predicted DNA repair protein MutK